MNKDSGRIAVGDRAGRAMPQAASRLDRPATIPCAGCGKFISYADIDAGQSRCEYEPLSDFGPERIDHICPRCIAAESTQSLRERGVCESGPGE